MFERISPYDDVFEQFRRFEQEIDELLSGGTSRNIRSFASGTFPAVNVATTPDSVHVYLFAPGIDPKSLDTSIQQNVLLISGSRQIQSPQEKGTFYRQERFNGSFRRVVALPDDIDADKVDAKYVDGIVQITIGRRAEAKPRQIEIH